MIGPLCKLGSWKSFDNLMGWHKKLNLIQLDFWIKQYSIYAFGYLNTKKGSQIDSFIET